MQLQRVQLLRGLNYNKLTLADGKFATAIAKITTLKELNLSYNNTNLQGIKHLANVLKTNNTLQTLDLNNNNNGDDGAQYIADMLANSKTLQKIDLSYNNISDKGAQSIATSLLVNSSIHTLHLTWNKIGKEGAKKLEEALEGNHSIKYLELSGNNICEDVTNQIQVILDKRKRMANKVNVTTKKDKVVAARVTPSDNTDTSINNDGNSSSSISSSLGGESATGIGKKPTPEQYEQMMAAENAKQSSASASSSSLTNSGPTSDQKMPASNNKRDTDNPLTDAKMPSVSTTVTNEEVRGGESQPPKKRQRLSQSIMGRLNPQRLNFGSLSSSSDSTTGANQSSITEEVDHAIDFVTTVRKRFVGHPEIHRKFLQILREYKIEQRSTKEVVDEVSLLFADHADLLKSFVFFVPDVFQAQAKEYLEAAIKKVEEKKKVSGSVNHQIAEQKDLTKDEENQSKRPHTEDASSRKKKKKNDELTKLKQQLNATVKEKEDALKLVASMKADITRKEEAIQMKEQEIKSRDTDIANKDQQLKFAKVEVRKVKSLEEENRRLKNELADAQKKVAERDIGITNKNKQLEFIKMILSPANNVDGELANEQHRTKDQIDHQLKSALDGITERDKDIAKKNKQLESIKRILNPVPAADEGEPATKRHRTEDTPPTTKPKIMSVHLGYEHTHCSICHSKFSTNTNNKDEDIRKHLPVLSASSKSCDHYFCHGCILKQQAAIAEQKRVEARKWIPCMVCKTKTSFCPSEPKNHRLLIDILKKAKWVDAPQVKEEPID